MYLQVFRCLDRYMAPEVFSHKAYDMKVDVFSFAMILYEVRESFHNVLYRVVAICKLALLVVFAKSVKNKGQSFFLALS